jgi:hypothetical protein
MIDRDRIAHQLAVDKSRDALGPRLAGLNRDCAAAVMF